MPLERELGASYGAVVTDFNSPGCVLAVFSIAELRMKPQRQMGEPLLLYTTIIIIIIVIVIVLSLFLLLYNISLLLMLIWSLFMESLWTRFGAMLF